MNLWDKVEENFKNVDSEMLNVYRRMFKVEAHSISSKVVRDMFVKGAVDDFIYWKSQDILVVNIFPGFPHRTAMEIFFLLEKCSELGCSDFMNLSHDKSFYPSTRSSSRDIAAEFADLFVAEGLGVFNSSAFNSDVVNRGPNYKFSYMEKCLFKNFYVEEINSPHAFKMGNVNIKKPGL